MNIQQNVLHTVCEQMSLDMQNSYINDEIYEKMY